MFTSWKEFFAAWSWTQLGSRSVQPGFTKWFQPISFLVFPSKLPDFTPKPSTSSQLKPKLCLKCRRHRECPRSAALVTHDLMSSRWSSIYLIKNNILSVFSVYAETATLSNPLVFESWLGSLFDVICSLVTTLRGVAPLECCGLNHVAPCPSSVTEVWPREDVSEWDMEVNGDSLPVIFTTSWIIQWWAILTCTHTCLHAQRQRHTPDGLIDTMQWQGHRKKMSILIYSKYQIP